MHRFVCALLISVLFLSSARADVLYGEIKPKNNVKISTSWNNKVAYAKDGKYRLDFGGTVDAYVTVYVSGKKVARIKVDGATRLDIDATK